MLGCNRVCGLLQESGSHIFSEERLSPENNEVPANSWSNAARTQADKRQVSIHVFHLWTAHCSRLEMQSKMADYCPCMLFVTAWLPSHHAVMWLLNPVTLNL